MKTKIWMIDDDLKLAELLQDYLNPFSWQLEIFASPLKALKKIEAGIHLDGPQLILLDIMLPELNGTEVLKKIRQKSNIPIIMLSARGEVSDKVLGLELGADDYLAKPFEPRELAARISSLLRRVAAAGNPSQPLDQQEFGELKIDLKSHQVWLKGKELEFSSQEFALLQVFIQHPFEVLSRDQLLNSLRGIEWDAYNRSVDVLLSRTRNRLNDDPKKPLYIKTIWGTGYMFIGGKND